MKLRRNTASALFSALILIAAVGCGTSRSYQLGVSDLYPVMADRMTPYAAADPAITPKIEGLRQAAQEPITYPVASDAWQSAAPDYREKIEGDTTLTDFRRTEWLLTADKLDELNAAEADRRKLLFLPP